LAHQRQKSRRYNLNVSVHVSGISAAAASSWGSDTARRTKSVSSLASFTSICVTSGKSAATRSGGFSFDLAHPALVSLTNVAVPHTVSTYMTAMHSTSFSSACKTGRSTCDVVTLKLFNFEPLILSTDARVPFGDQPAQIMRVLSGDAFETKLSKTSVEQIMCRR